MSLSHEVLYGTEKHNKLRDYVLRLVDYAATSHSDFRERTKLDDRMYYAYVDPPKNEKTGGKSREVNARGEKEYTTVSIPYAYAMCLVYHTYLCSTFLSRQPVLQYQGRHGETTDQETMVESLMDYQLTAAGTKPILSHWLLDACRYGGGIIGTQWEEHVDYVGKLVEINNMPGTKLFGTKKQYIEQPVVKYAGNVSYPVRGLDFIWDPRFALVDFQKGEFAGEHTLLPLFNLSRLAESGEYIKANLDKVSDKYRYYEDREKGEDRVQPEREVVGPEPNATDRPFVLNCIDLNVKLIPSDWGLSASKRPTLYKLTLAERDVLVRVAPAGCFSQKFPYNVLSFEVDYYKKHPRSMMQIMEPLENTLNWLLNQHFYNVRKHLNNQFVVDPSKVVLKDFYQREPGGIIRLRPEAYGSDPRLVAAQLQATDITRSHLSDMRTIEEFMQRITGANDNVMGLVDPGGRKTAAEVRTSSAFATNRIKNVAEWFSMTGFDSFSQMMLQNTQQYMSAEQIVRIAGDLSGNGSLENFVKVTPEDIAGHYSFIPVDGTMPIDRQAMANIMRDLFQQATNVPQIAQSYDLGRIFESISEMAGIRNIKRFKVQVLPPGMGPAPGQIPMAPGNGQPPQPTQVPGNGNPNIGPVGP